MDGLGRLRNVLWACLVAVCLAVSAQAQTASGPDYDAWEAVAQRAELTIEQGNVSEARLDRLRSSLVVWRTRFEDAAGANDPRADTLREQIAALGPAPPEGESEPEDIAAQRAELTDALSRQIAPVRTAQAAFSRADGLIGEIDTILRARRADTLLRMGPWPINPVWWPQALSDVAQTLGNVVRGTGQAISDPDRLRAAQNVLPLLIVSLAFAFVCLSRGRRFMGDLALRVSRMASGRSPSFLGFLVSIGQIVLPLLGMFALVYAVFTSGLYGDAMEPLLRALPMVATAILTMLWLGGRLFSDDPEIGTPIGLPIERKREGQVHVGTLGVLGGLKLVWDQLSASVELAEATLAVVDFILIVLAAVAFFRLGQLLRQSDPEDAQMSAESAFRNSGIVLAGRAAMLVAVLAPILAAFGFRVAAEGMFWQSVVSLGIFGFLVLLQDAIRDAYAFFTPGEDGHDALIPTLIGFLVGLCFLPVLALVWGARVTDLTEFYAQLRNGLTIGETTISPGSFFTLLIVFLLGYFLTRMVQGLMKTSVLPKTNIDPGGQVAVVSGLGYVGIFLAALVAITAAGIDLSSVAIVAGALSVGIGFGLQNIVSNFVSGIILLIERPISEGDWIEVGGHMGYVRDISVRSTRIETFDRTDVIVPNADLVSGTVTNYTRGNTVGRLIVPVGVAYGTNTRRVEELLMEIAEAHPMIVAHPPPAVMFTGLGASSLDFEIRAILRDVNWVMSVKNDILHQIVERFVAEDIEIPFAQTDLWLRNPETLRDPDPDGTPAPHPKET